MLKEYSKDLGYILRVIRTQFQLVASMKLTVIPLFVWLAGLAAEHLGWIVIPSWVWPILAVYFILIVILFLITRQARELKEPVFSVFFDESQPEYVVSVENGTNPAIRLRVLPVVSSYAYAGAILNSVYKETSTGWKPTTLNEALHLKWSNTGTTVENIFHEVRQFLDLVEIYYNGHVSPMVSEQPLHTRDAFWEDGTYRLDILLTNMGRPDKFFSVKFKKTKNSLENIDAKLVGYKDQ